MNPLLTIISKSNFSIRILISVKLIAPRFIINMAWKGLNAAPSSDDAQYASDVNINHALNQQYSHDKRYKKLLNIVAYPRKNADNFIEI